MNATITIPIDIPDIEVLGSEITAEKQLLIRVESKQMNTKCGVCGKPIKCTFGHGQEIRLRHVSVLGLECYILIRPKRGQCLSCYCDPTTTQIVSWYQQRSPHTQAYDEYLLKQLINSTIEDVSLKEQVGYDAIQGVVNRQIDKAINWSEVSALGIVGIDEIAMSKGHKTFSAIITARQPDRTIRILAVLPDRKKATVKAFLEQIPARLRPTITHFTTDMWEGYLTAIDEFIAEHADVTAASVIDRFHVAQQYREDFDDLRKQELKRLKKELPKQTYEQDCKGLLWLLRKNHADLEKEEQHQLRQLLVHSPLLHQAYTFREELTAIFNLNLSLTQADTRLRAWIRKVDAAKLDTFTGFIQTLNNHWQPILNYFPQRVSSGFVEGLNNKIKTIKRRCYGIRKSFTLFQRIWLDLQGRQRFLLSTT
jgi:transposase